ncbi:MAG: DNA/RNA nuclease SfsA [Firmicutes bacterium]|nr:DNA/RNA nuclease SfsA [Bacillota bacterium]
MRYSNIKEGIFLRRPNRFIAHVEIDGKEEICHVKNTGRCRELLKEGARVLVEEFDSPHRKTKYDLVSVYKGDRLVNMDSQAPNKIFGEWLRAGNLFQEITLLKPECTFGNSRFDFYVEADGRKAFMEVKGVTLEEGNVARFPDAPTERGLKHLRELAACMDAGYDAYVVFIIQMKDILYVEANRKTHPAFADALKEVVEAGVRPLALDCLVTPGNVVAKDFVEVRV